MLNVTLERLIRNLPTALNIDTESKDFEDEDEEDDFNGGRCSTHRKENLYFYCDSHQVQICRQCTVIDHAVGVCKIISIKKLIETRNEDEICKASLTIRAISDTLSALNKCSQEKDRLISEKQLEIQQYEKKVEDARNAIDREKAARDKIQKEISYGTIQEKNGEYLESSKFPNKDSDTKWCLQLYPNLESSKFPNKDSDTKWCLQLYPRGYTLSKSHFLSLYLKCCSLTAEFVEVKGLFKISTLDAEGKETNIKVRLP